MTNRVEVFDPERLAGVVDAVSEPITVRDVDGRIVYANPAAARAAGRDSPQDLIDAAGPGVALFDLFDEGGRPIGSHDLPWQVAVRTGQPHSATIRYGDRVTGAQRWVTIAATPLLDADGRPEFAVQVIHDVTGQKTVEEALRVSEARARLLANAARHLDESLDLDRTVAAAMAIAVPELADWATLDLAQPDGSFARVASVAGEPARQELAARLRAYTSRPGPGWAADQALDARRPVIADLSADGLVADPERPGHVEAIRALETTSAIAVPLIARDAVEGVLVLAACRDSRQYDDGDSFFAMQFAKRIALAIQNARLYGAEQAARRAAESAVRRNEALLTDLEAERARLETILRNLPMGVIVAEAPTEQTILVNEAVDQILGTTGLMAADVWSGRVEAYWPDGRRLGPDDWPLARAIRRGEAVAHDEIRIRRPDGSDAWIAARSVPILDAAGRVTSGVVVWEDITIRRRQTIRTEFLSEASRILSSSLDYESTIQRVARLAVPTIADWSAVDIVAEDGRLQHLALTHADPTRAAAVIAARDRLAGLTSESVSEQVARIRESLTGTLTAELIDGAIAALPSGVLEDGLESTIRGLAGTSYVCVPLIAGGECIGTLTLATDRSSSTHITDELPLAEELAGRAASAIQNARLFRDVSRFRTILDAVHDGVTILDQESLRVTYANDGLLSQLGRTRDEVIGHHSAEWTEGLEVHELRALLAPVVSREVGSCSLDLVRRRSDGTEVPVEIRWQLVELPGAGAQIVAISREIGERLEAQRRLTHLATAEHARVAELNAIIRAIGDGVVVMDSAGQVTLANPTAEAMLEPVEEWTSKALAARFEDPDGFAQDALSVPGTTATIRLRGAKERWVEISTYAVGSVHAPDRELIVILRDVTAAHERDAVREAFMGILSHELRTPVTTIFAGSKVLARNESGLDPEARREIFTDIHVEAERLQRLVEDVIALNRFGEGAADIGSEPTLLQRIIPSVVRSEQNRWPGVQFEVAIEPDLPPVSGDPTYVEQVVRNLMANAVKYAGTGTPILLAAQAAGDEVEVRVLDEGPGFAEDEAERLFELYYRSPGVARQVSGSGIGLFVCARLVSAMGGRIWAANRPEGGAEFGFALQVMGEGD